MEDSGLADTGVIAGDLAEQAVGVVGWVAPFDDLVFGDAGAEG